MKIVKLKDFLVSFLLKKYIMKIQMKYFAKTFSSLKIRNYRLYFIGQAISLSGNWMQTVSQSWLVLQLTKSGTALGLVLALQFLPILFLAPYGGLVADRFSKRKILYITQSVSAMLALILGIMVVTGLIQVWMVYIFALCLGLVNVFDNPTRQTFAIEMVSKKELSNAIALNSAEINMARVLGPALAGILIASIGLGFCFIFNAFSYIAVLIALFLMRENELHKTPLVEKAKGQIIEGFKYVKKNPVIRDILIMMTIIGTLTYEFNVSLPLMAEFTFKGNANTFAMLTSAIGFGSVIGGLFAANRRKTSPRALVPGAFIFGCFVLLTAIAPTLFLAIISLIAVGFMSIYFTSLGNVTLQLESSPEMRGRVMALWAIAFLGSTPIGSPIIGYIGENFGARWSLVVGGLAAIIAAGIGYVSLNKIKLIAIQKNSEIEISEATAESDLRIP